MVVPCWYVVPVAAHLVPEARLTAMQPVDHALASAAHNMLVRQLSILEQCGQTGRDRPLLRAADVLKVLIRLGARREAVDSICSNVYGSVAEPKYQVTAAARQALAYGLVELLEAFARSEYISTGNTTY